MLSLLIKNNRKLKGQVIGTLRLKRQIRILLLLDSILPLLLLGIIVSIITFTLYRQSMDSTIMDELNQLDGEFNDLMDNMKYTSQLLVNDNDLIEELQNHSIINSAERGRALIYLNGRITLCETANPNIANITLFYGDKLNMGNNTGQRFADVNGYEKINSSLAFGNFLDEQYRLSTQNLLTFYGPHPTRSVVSIYPVLSMTRKMDSKTIRPIYIYMETGFKVLSDFSTATLNRLDAVYTVISDNGSIIYSSDHSRVPLGLGDSADLIQGYEIYESASVQGWSLRTYVPDSNVYSYIAALAISVILTIIAAAGLTLVLSSMMWRRVNIFSKNNTKLETKLIIYKINPHFLHNTLHTLKCYSEVNGYGDVESFISALNRLLRYNMEKNPRTTLRSELESIGDYIELQKIKYQIHFSIENRLPDEMTNAFSPRFILYPLVENAIMHGAKGKGEILLTLAFNQDGRIRISVQDSGVPMSPQEIHTLREKVRLREGTGIGLSYVDGALSDFFGSEGQLLISAGESGNMFEILMPCTIEKN